MYILNQTINIDESVSELWLKWMNETYIPRTIKVPDCVKISLFKVLVNEEMGGITYSVQYFSETRQKLQAFHKENRPIFIREMDVQFPNKFVIFETELELINEVKE